MGRSYLLKADSCPGGTVSVDQSAQRSQAQAARSTLSSTFPHLQHITKLQQFHCCVYNAYILRMHQDYRLTLPPQVTCPAYDSCASQEGPSTLIRLWNAVSVLYRRSEWQSSGASASKRGANFTHCDICGSEINIGHGGIGDKKHIATAKHQEMAKVSNSNTSLRAYFRQSPLEESVTGAKVLFANFIDEHNCHFCLQIISLALRL